MAVDGDTLGAALALARALNAENVEAISDMIEDTQTALNTVNDIIGNSFTAYAEGETLVIEPLSRVFNI